MRVFETGATRDTDQGKLDFEGFLSPLALRRFAEFMNKNRYQKNGQLRDSDNWQRGIPRETYMKSGWRHFFDWWETHRGWLNEGSLSPEQENALEEELCALFFNVQGYLHEHLKEKQESDAYQILRAAAENNEVIDTAFATGPCGGNRRAEGEAWGDPAGDGC